MEYYQLITNLKNLNQADEMKKQQQKFLTLLAMSFSFVATYAQDSITASGGNATGVGGSSSYSIGQATYTSQTGSGGLITLGVQQPYEIVTLGKDDFTEISLVMSIYPNPTFDNPNLLVSDNKWTDLSYQLSDINGRILSKSKKITTSQTMVSMQELQQGIYFLAINSDNKTIKTFKIIKK